MVLSHQSLRQLTDALSLSTLHAPRHAVHIPHGHILDFSHTHSPRFPVIAATWPVAVYLYSAIDGLCTCISELCLLICCFSSFLSEGEGMFAALVGEVHRRV